HRLATGKTQRRPQRFVGPLFAPRAPAARALARRLPAVDLAAGQGHAEQVFVDGVGLLFRAHAEAAFLQVGLLVGAGLRVLLLDFADRGDDAVVAGSPAPGRRDSKVEAHLVVAHAGAAVGDGIGAQFGSARQRGIHDQVTIRHQQRVLALVALARPYERAHEAVPQRG